MNDEKHAFADFKDKKQETKAKKFFIKYLGKGLVRISGVKGVSRVESGKKYEVPKNIYDSFVRAENWETTTE